MKIHERKPLSRREFGFLLMKQEGKCACGCGEKLDFSKDRQITDEHVRPRREGGTNDLENRQLWRTVCTKPKTKKESKARAKAARHEDGRTQADKRRQSGPKLKSPQLSRLNSRHPNYKARKFS